MPGIFISYRRDDCPGHAGRIFDRLRARFGPGVVFMDVATIDVGVDFVDVLQRAVGSCDALLAIIGPEWLTATESGRRRLDDERDFVRLEIAGALARNVRVVPVLVDGATMPATSDLPADLQALSRRQAIELRDTHWDDDIDRLIAGVERVLADAGGDRASHDAARAAVPHVSAPPVGTQRSGASFRMFGAIAAAVVLIAVAATVGPRACSARPAAPSAADGSPRAPEAVPVSSPPAAPTPAVAPAAASGSSASAAIPPAAGASPVSEPAANAVGSRLPRVPDVVGKSLADARAELRAAGAAMTVRYVEDRVGTPEVVRSQALARDTQPGQPPLVVVTVPATSSIVIQFRAGDERIADELVTHLRGLRVTTTSVVRKQMMPAVRPELAGRVGYSEPRLAAQAQAVAAAASTYLADRDSRRQPLQPAERPRVVRGSIVIGLATPTR